MLIAHELPTLKPALQKALAELLLIRLFDDLQDSLAGIAYRLACGAPYMDSAAPRLLTAAANSSDGARHLFENHDRTKAKYVKWSKARYIRETVKFVLDPSEPFLAAVDANSMTIAEMQAIRNRIAHRNASTRKAYDPVVRRYYGAAPPSVSPGILLLSNRVAPPPLMRYLTATRVIVKDCARA